MKHNDSEQKIKLITDIYHNVKHCRRKPSGPHLGADTDEPARHGEHQVVLLCEEGHDPAVDRLAGQLSWWWNGYNETLKEA